MGNWKKIRLLFYALSINSQGRVFLGDKGIPLETKDIVASNGIIHLVDGLLVPSSIVPIMPHRCDINGSRISLVGAFLCVTTQIIEFNIILCYMHMDNKTSVQWIKKKKVASFHRVPVSDAAISMRQIVHLEVLSWYLMFPIIYELYTH